ncbi:MAG TPA: winged helix-turn-helix domain-containing protein [Caulobacteraceae bacterium]|jgi:TolB-like protein
MSADEAPLTIDLAREARFRLAEVEVRPSTRELLSGAQREVLEPRVMQVLVVLARRQGEVVSRDDLIASCWGGRVVGDDAINRCISLIRGAAHRHGGFNIQTIARVGYRLRANEPVSPDAERASPLTASSAPHREPLLAVLAFDNLSPDPEMSFFSDGVSEEILETVSRNTDLKVIGRGSSFQFRGADKAARHVAAELNVSHVLDGSVRRSGSRVRISAQLVECTSETRIWSARFDGDLTDIFALQDEIAAALADALEKEFARSGRQLGKVDPASYDLFLRSRDVSNGGTFSERIKLLEQCVALAPGFANGWAWLAYWRVSQAKRDRGDLALERLLEAALSDLATAERLDPNMGFTRKVREEFEPHAAYQRREALLREALRLSPGDPMCLTCAADILGEVGRHREAFALAEEAKALDPLLPLSQSQSQDAPPFQWALQRWISLLEDYDERAAQFEAMLAKWPTLADPLISAANNAAENADWPRYDALRRSAYAQPFAQLPEAQRLMRDTFGFHDAIRARDRAYLDDLAKRLLSRVDRTGAAPLDAIWSVGLAGHVEAAFQAVDQATFDRAFAVGRGRISRWWAGNLFRRSVSAALIDDPRFLRLCAKLGLVHYWLETGRWPDCADKVAYDFRAEARKVAAAGLARHV